MQCKKALPIKHEEGDERLEVGRRSEALLVEEDEDLHHQRCADGVVHLQEEIASLHRLSAATFIVASESSGRTSDKFMSTYHVPEEVGHPVDQGTDAADKLEVLGLSDPLLDQVEDKTGRDEGHGEDDADGHDRVHGGGQAGGTEKEAPTSRADSS